MIVKRMRLSTCLPIYLTVANMCKTTITEATTLGTIKIPTYNFPLRCEISKNIPSTIIRFRGERVFVGCELRSFLEGLCGDEVNHNSTGNDTWPVNVKIHHRT